MRKFKSSVALGVLIGAPLATSVFAQSPPQAPLGDHGPGQHDAAPPEPSQASPPDPTAATTAPPATPSAATPTPAASGGGTPPTVATSAVDASGQADALLTPAVSPPAPPPAQPAAAGAPAGTVNEAALPPTPTPIGSEDLLDQGLVKEGESLAGVQVLGAVGYAFGSVSRPDYAKKTARGATIEAGISYRFLPEWSMGLQVWGSEAPVARLESGKYGSTDSPKRMPAGATRNPVSYAGCTTCTDPIPGGVVYAHSLRTVLVGPRVEFSPEILAGGYIGAGAGIGSVALEETKVAGGVTGRLGYRHQLVKAVAVGVGLGFTAILVDEGHTWMPHGGVEVLLR